MTTKNPAEPGADAPATVPVPWHQRHWGLLEPEAAEPSTPQNGEQQQ